MTHAESLARLAAWRRSLRTFGPIPGLDDASANTARAHGFAAVRAIRTCSDILPGWPCLTCDSTFTIRESRLAFRLALAACGLKVL